MKIAYTVSSDEIENPYFSFEKQLDPVKYSFIAKKDVENLKYKLENYVSKKHYKRIVDRRLETFEESGEYKEFIDPELREVVKESYYQVKEELEEGIEELSEKVEKYTVGEDNEDVKDYGLKGLFLGLASVPLALSYEVNPEIVKATPIMTTLAAETLAYGKNKVKESIKNGYEDRMSELESKKDNLEEFREKFLEP